MTCGQALSVNSRWRSVRRAHIEQLFPVRLTAPNRRTTLALFGEIYYVSAESITNLSAEGPDAEVYVARISIQPQELLRVPGFSPTPGMPAEIMIQTAERTFVDYITKPIRDSMIRAFREQ